MKLSRFHASLPLVLGLTLAATAVCWQPAEPSTRAAESRRASPGEFDYEFDLYVPRAGVHSAEHDQDFEFVDPAQHPRWYESAKEAIAADDELRTDAAAADERRIYLFERPEGSETAAACRCMPAMTWFAPGCMPVIDRAGFGGGYRSSPCGGIGCSFVAAQMRITFVGGGGMRVPAGGFTGGIACPPSPFSSFVGPCPAGGTLKVKFFCLTIFV